MDKGMGESSSMVGPDRWRGSSISCLDVVVLEQSRAGDEVEWSGSNGKD